MLNIKKLNSVLCLTFLLISGTVFAIESETKATDAIDIMTVIQPKTETKNALLGCTTTPAACSRLAGQYGYPYYYAEVDYELCYSNYPYACYGIN